MLYQQRFAHLEEKSPLKVGDIVGRGQKIGRMGSSGKSNAPHLHTDIIQAVEPGYVYRLGEIMGYITQLDLVMEQYHYSLDGELFGISTEDMNDLKAQMINPVVITSYFGDPSYFNHGVFEFHPAYDVVPYNRHETKANFDLYWNRSKTGKVVRNDYDGAYGYHLCIAFQG